MNNILELYKEKINQLSTIELPSKIKDKTGKQQGKLIFIKPAEIVNGRSYWWVICECGTIEKVRSDTTKTCCNNCSKQQAAERRKGKKIKDLTNQQFGRLTALYLLDKRTNKKGAIWHCKCECGNECDIAATNLLSHNTLSCGCLQKEKAAEVGRNTKKDLTGQRFGFLTAIKETDKRQGRCIVWECKCDCGNTHYVSSGELRRGKIKSCGCQHYAGISERNTIDIIGKQFGKLTVLEKAGKDPDGSWNYLCQCECGNQKIINGVSLRSGTTQSCGCINYSIGEKNIYNLLKENNIIFQSEYKFQDLKQYRYDFVIFKDNNKQQIKRIIEFDGKQHYEEVLLYTEGLVEIQRRDKEKNEYALSHNIPLVRIPYWERDNITLEMLMGDQYLIKE